MNQAFQESLASYVRRQRDVMGRARGCPRGLFPGEGPRPSTWPSQVLQSPRSGLWTLSAACWRAQAAAELRVHPGALSEAVASAVDSGQSQLGCWIFQLLLPVAKLSRACEPTPGSKVWLCHLSGVLRFCQLPPTFPREPRTPSYGCEFAPLFGLP